MDNISDLLKERELALSEASQTVTNVEEEEDLKTPSQRSAIVLSNEEVLDIIRPEKNLDEWQAFIFPPKQADNLYEDRTNSFPVKLPD
jgi:hypothetical protein